MTSIGMLEDTCDTVTAFAALLEQYNNQDESA